MRRSAEDLRKELTEQLQLLRLTCASFDAGNEVVGRQIAASLRLLLNQRPPNQRALLDQVGLRDGRWLDSAGGFAPGNLLAEFPFLMVRVTDAGATYLPLLGVGANKWRPFTEWWLQDVLKLQDGRRFNRMNIVLHVANTDGGTHVDAELDEAYAELSRGIGLGFMFENASGTKPVEGRPEFACLRQIAFELEQTIAARAPRP